MTWSVKIDILNWINVSHRQYSKQKNRWKQDIHARNVSYYQQNSCLNLDSCSKLERYCIQESYRTKHCFLNRNKGENDVKCKDRHSQLENVSHRQYSKQKNRWKQDIHARNVSYYQQNSCLNLDSCSKLERYCRQDSYHTKHCFSE